MGRWLISSSLILISLPLLGQRIENLRATFGEGKVTVQYDIIGGNPRQTFSIQLYGSHNNYSTPLGQVTGDVGEGVMGGKDKTIIWNAEGELITHSGNITFRVSGNLIPMKLSILKPDARSSLRRGKDAVIQWEGGAPEQVQIELFKGNTRITSVGDSKNTGSISWRVPKDMDKGNYTLKLTAGIDQVTSEVFTIRPKTGMMVKIIPVVLVAGAVGWLLTGDDTTSDKLPPAPDPN